MIGKPKNNKHPLDEVSDADLLKVLMESELSSNAVSQAMGLKGKYRDLLMAIVEAGQEGDLKKVNILADTLAVGMGLTDPRKKENDPDVAEVELPAHAKRSWYNG